MHSKHANTLSLPRSLQQLPPLHHSFEKPLSAVFILDHLHHELKKLMVMRWHHLVNESSKSGMLDANLVVEAKVAL